MSVNIISIFLLYFLTSGCATVDYTKTVDKIDIHRFMGDWYVVAGRTTFLEKNAFNSLEQYSWNVAKNRIDIKFTFNKGSFTGNKKIIGQKAWIENQTTKAHWKVQPFWPLKLDYLVLALDPDYKWTIIGVPSQSYVWIMTRESNPPEALIASLIKKVSLIDYADHDIKIIPQKWTLAD